MTHILVFGDSTTYGANDTQGGWVQRIRKRLDVHNIPRGKYFLTYNMGISGGNTTQMVKRFKNEASIRLDDDPKESNIWIRHQACYYAGPWCQRLFAKIQ